MSLFYLFRKFRGLYTSSNPCTRFLKYKQWRFLSYYKMILDQVERETALKKDARWETHAVITCSKILCSNYRGLCCITFFLLFLRTRNAWYLLLHSKTQTISSECNSMGTQTPVRFLNLHQLQRWMLPKNLSLVCFLKHMHEKPYPKFIYCLFQTG